MFIQNDKKFINRIKYVYFLLPLIYLLKLNIATLVISLFTLIFLIYKIRYPKNIPGVFFLLFFYIFLHGLFFHNLNEYFYIRFFLFTVVIVSVLENLDLKILYKYLFITLSFALLDTLLQYLLGYNLLGNIKLAYLTSFFGDEKILGTFFLKCYLILLIVAFLINKKKYINLSIYLFPIIFLAIIFSGQRSILISSILLFLVLTLYLIFKTKKYIRIFLIGIIFTMSAMYIIKQNSHNYTYSRITKIYKEFFLSKKIYPTFQLYNNFNYEKIKLNIKNNNLSYDEIIGYGVIDGKNIQFSIKDFVNDSRVEKDTFYFCIDGDQCHSSESYDINEKLSAYILSLSLKRLSKNEPIIYLKSRELHELKKTDLAWYAHARIAYEIWKKNPIFGVGLKNYRNLCHEMTYKNFESFSKQFCPSHPHNYIFEIMAELGIIGLILLLLVLCSIVISIANFKINLINRVFLIIFLIIFFQFWLPTGRFFSSNESFYYFYIMTIFFIYKTNNKKI
jgi:hypothetical protein